MKSDSFDPLAEAIADGVPIDVQEGTLSLGDDDLYLANLERIQLMSNLSKTNPQSEAIQSPQFTWGHLNVFEKIGAGGYGEVYRAFDTVLQREVALKLCRTDKAIIIGKRPYLEEARRLARVRHPGVLPIYGADDHNSRVGLWCELVHGTSLDKKLQKNGPFAFTDSLSLAIQVTEALISVHQSQMVHGDIKLSNLMLNEDGKPLLMDFGAVTDLSQEGTGSQSLMGTPMYMAPEVMGGQKPSYKSDVYSLGVSFFRLTTQSFPFKSDQFASLLYEKQKPLAIQNPKGFPKSWKRVLQSCLAPDPKDRFSAKELHQALKRIESAPRRRKKRFVIGTIILVLSLVASGFAGLSFQLNRQFKRADHEAQTSSQLVQMLTQMFDTARTSVRSGEEISAKALVEEAIYQTQKDELDPEIRMRLNAILGRVIRHLGNAALSRDYLMEGIERGSKTLPPNHPWILRAKVELVYTYHVLSNYKLSIQTGQEVMPFVDELDPSISVAFHTHLAESYQSNEQFDLAHDLFQKALNIYEQNPERVSPFQSSVANTQMALYFLATEDPDQALPYLKKAEQIMQEHIPKSHPNWALIYESQSHAYETKGELRQALQFAQKAHDHNTQVFTEIHPNIFTSMANLGRIHVLLKEFEKGKALYLEALEIMEEFYSERDYTLAKHRANIGALMIELGEPQRSQQLTEQVMPIFEEKFGRVSQPSAMARLTLANAHLAQDHFEVADKIYKELIADCDAIQGSGVPKAMALNNLGESKTFQGKFNEGQRYIEQALGVIGDLFGEKHPLYAEILIYLVDNLIESGQFERAQNGLEQCQSIFKETVPESGIELKRLAAWQAVLDKRRGNSAPNWPKIIGELEAQMGPKSPEIEKLHQRWGFNDS